MVSFRLAVLAASSALLFSAATSATPGKTPTAGIDGAKLVLAYLDVGTRPPGMSTPFRPVAQTCHDKCEADQDKCFNDCPADPVEGSVCRNACTDTYNACLKGC